MPYQNIDQLPESVRDNLPKHAQEIYVEAFNSALEQYKDPKKRNNPKENKEEVCHKVAWAAVKKTYHQSANREWVHN